MGADAVIDSVNASKTVETDMQFLRRARLVLVGLFGGELKLSLVMMPTRAYRLIGSYTGTISEGWYDYVYSKRDLDNILLKIKKPKVFFEYKNSNRGISLF